MSITVRLPTPATLFRLEFFDEYGQPKRSLGEVIKVRWQQAAELFVDAEGREVRSKAVVYALDEMSAGDQLLLGDEYEGQFAPNQANEVRAVQHSHALRGNAQTLFKVML